MKRSKLLVNLALGIVKEKDVPPIKKSKNVRNESQGTYPEYVDLFDRGKWEELDEYLKLKHCKRHSVQGIKTDNHGKPYPYEDTSNGHTIEENPQLGKDCSTVKAPYEDTLDGHTIEENPQLGKDCSTVEAPYKDTSDGHIIEENPQLGNDCSTVEAPYEDTPDGLTIEENPQLGKDCSTVEGPYEDTPDGNTIEENPQLGKDCSTVEAPYEDTLDGHTIEENPQLGKDCSTVEAPYEDTSDGHTIEENPQLGKDCSTVEAPYEDTSDGHTIEENPQLGNDCSTVEAPYEDTPDGHTIEENPQLGKDCSTVEVPYEDTSDDHTIEENPQLGKDCSTVEAPYEDTSDGHIIEENPRLGNDCSTVEAPYEDTPDGLTIEENPQLGKDCSTVEGPYEDTSDDHTIEENPQLGKDCFIVEADSPKTAYTFTDLSCNIIHIPYDTPHNVVSYIPYEDTSDDHTIEENPQLGKDCSTVEGPYEDTSDDHTIEENPQLGKDCSTVEAPYEDTSDGHTIEENPQLGNDCSTVEAPYEDTPDGHTIEENPQLGKDCSTVEVPYEDTSDDHTIEENPQLGEDCSIVEVDSLKTAYTTADLSCNIIHIPYDTPHNVVSYIPYEDTSDDHTIEENPQLGKDCYAVEADSPKTAYTTTDLSCNIIHVPYDLPHNAVSYIPYEDTSDDHTIEENPQLGKDCFIVEADSPKTAYTTTDLSCNIIHVPYDTPHNVVSYIPYEDTSDDHTIEENPQLGKDCYAVEADSPKTACTTTDLSCNIIHVPYDLPHNAVSYIPYEDTSDDHTIEENPQLGKDCFIVEADSPKTAYTTTDLSCNIIHVPYDTPHNVVSYIPYEDTSDDHTIEENPQLGKDCYVVEADSPKTAYTTTDLSCNIIHVPYDTPHNVVSYIPYEDTSDDHTIEENPQLGIDCSIVEADSPKTAYTTTDNNGLSFNITLPNSTKHQRTWDRKNCCIYCRSLVSNFSRHIVRWHSAEKEVMEFNSILDENLRERKRKRQLITDDLRRRGNFMYNSLKSKDESLLPTRRSPKIINGSNKKSDFDYVTCRYCLGMFSRKTFYRHGQKCPKKEISESKPFEEPFHVGEVVFGKNKMQGSWKKDGILLLGKEEDEPHITAFHKTIAPIINKDEYGLIAMNDPLIVQIGAHFLMNHNEKKDQYNCTKKVRDAAKLLKVCRADPDIVTFSDCFKPAKFHVLMRAVNELCGVDHETGTVHVIGMPARLLYVIQEGANILTCQAIANDKVPSIVKDGIIKEVNEFTILMKHKWKFMISTNAEKSRKRKLSIKPRVLPDDEDIKLVATRIKSLELQYYNNLLLNLNADDYEKLCKAVIAHMIVLNRRRSGEVARAELKYYLNRPPQDELTEDVLSTLTEEEKNTLPMLTVFMVPGKLVHSVPILLTEHMKKSVDLLISCRASLKIPNENPLLFARICTNRPFDGSKIIRDIRETCDLKKKDHMTATGLRHHVATKSQVYGSEKYTENVCQFLGHTSHIHKQNYRIPLQAIQRGQIGYKLLDMEGSTLPTAQSLDSHEIDSCKTKTSSVKFSSSFNKLSDENDPDYLPPEESASEEELQSPSELQKRSVTARKRWLEEEKTIVIEELGHFIKNRKNPGMAKCLDVIGRYPQLAKRSWSQVNVLINNYIKGKTKLPRRYLHLLN